MEVVVAGHVCVDLIPALPTSGALVPGHLREAGPLTMRAGGCVANTGLDLASLGARVRLVADVGDDALGRVLLELLEHENADTAGVRVVGGCTSYSIVVQPPEGDRAFWHHVGTNATIDVSRIDLCGAGFLHVGYPTALPGLDVDALVELLDRARAAGVQTSIDLSTFEPDSETAMTDWPAVLDAVLPHVDVFAASVDDLACVYGRDADPSELLDAGAGCVLLKAGMDGLHLVRRECVLWEPSIDVDVVSTTGAGDAAVAGLLFGRTRGMAWDDSLRVASAAAAARVSRHGRLPSWSELVSDRAAV